jgi:hypothetical protein
MAMKCDEIWHHQAGFYEGFEAAKAKYQKGNSYGKMLRLIQNIKWDLEEGHNELAIKRLKQLYEWL